MFADNGFAIVPGALSDEEVTSLLESLGSLGAASGKGGVRNVFEKIPAIGHLADSHAVRGLVAPILGKHAFAVRCILFDKTSESNWKVPWHQDLTIAVEKRIEAPGFGPWTTKDGVQHVQPPTAVLEGMLAVRIHLDDCGEANGPLRVIPGSHLHGRLTAERIRAFADSTAVACPVQRGGAILMRPLLLHASSAATLPHHRRVIHIEFAAQPLPGALRWLSC